MRTSEIMLQAENGNNEKPLRKSGTDRLLKSALVIFMLVMITLLSSCMFPGPGGGTRGGPHERRGNMERHGHDRGHDNDDRRH